MLEDIGFELFLDGIREFHASVREKFYAIVVIRIVRGGDYHAGVKVVLSNETSDSRGGNDAGKGDSGASLLESGGEKSRDMRPGLAGVHADENVGGGMFAKQVGSERAAGGKEGSVVERRSAGNAADAVCAEEFFGHEGAQFECEKAEARKV